MKPDRSIQQILREAWKEIRDQHGITVTQVDFDVLWTVAGTAHLANSSINGKATGEQA